METHNNVRNMLEVNNQDTRTMSLSRSGVFMINFEHITYYSGVPDADFEQVNVVWVS